MPQTLRDLLVTSKLPLTGFTVAELEVRADGVAGVTPNFRFLAYRQASGELLQVPTRLVAYTPSTHLLIRRALLNGDDICSGPPGGVTRAGDYTLISVSISPSAECQLVLNKELELTRTIFGISPVNVAPDHVVLVENEIHFAPVHAARLADVDLRTGKYTEIYPAQHDPLRLKVVGENAAHMPTASTCAQFNDPCDPTLLEEDVLSLTTPGPGRLTALLEQSGQHVIAANTPPETTSAQTVRYTFAQQSDGAWLFCEQLATTNSSCTPALKITPDLGSADYNPTPQ